MYFRDAFAVDGDRITVPVDAQPDGSVSWQQGYGPDYSEDPNTNPAALQIERTKWNEIGYEITLALQQYQQHATPDWISSADNDGTPYSYSIQDRVRHGGVVYQSLIDANEDEPPSDNWAVVYSGLGLSHQNGDGAAYTYNIANSGAELHRTNTGSAMSDTLPGGSDVLPAGTTFIIANDDVSGILSVKCASGPTLNGSSGFFYVGPKQRLTITSDGDNYFTADSLDRIKLAASTTFYVATTGSNTANDGLTIGTPFATIQYAVDWLARNVNINGYTATIQLADGTYAKVAINTPFVGQAGLGSVIVNGNSGTPANVLVTSADSAGAFVATGAGIMLTPQNFKISNSSTGAGLGAGSGAVIQCGAGMDFGVCGAAQINAQDNAKIFVQNNYKISGSAPIHMQSSLNSSITAAGATITLTGTPAFATAFANATNNGTLLLTSMAFSGSATGSRYAVTANGVIQTGSAGATYLPGNSAGSSATGGQYI